MTFLLNDELGRIDFLAHNNHSVPVSVVPVMTLDEIMFREGLDHVDVLKIDTEGHDASVIRGGINALKRGAVSFVIFEFTDQWVESFRPMGEMFEKFGYSCYGDMRYGFLKYTHGCWTDAFQARYWGNAFCVYSRSEHGKELVRLCDARSLQFRGK